MPIKNDTDYLCDAYADGIIGLKDNSKVEVTLQMSVENRAVFGEKFSFVLINK